MNFFRKLERKFGRFAIPNLMYYIIMMYAAGFVMSLFNPYFYVQYLALDAAAILRGQVWRLVTWVLYPPSTRMPASVGRPLCTARDVSLLFDWIDAGTRVGNLPI